MYDSCDMKHRDKDSAKLSSGGHIGNNAAGTLIIEERLGGRKMEFSVVCT